LADFAGATLVTGATLACWRQGQELGPGVAGAIRMRMIENCGFSAFRAASAPSNAACGSCYVSGILREKLQARRPSTLRS